MSSGQGKSDSGFIEFGECVFEAFGILKFGNGCFSGEVFFWDGNSAFWLGINCMYEYVVKGWKALGYLDGWYGIAPYPSGDGMPFAIWRRKAPLSRILALEGIG
jgi:hypothetical protein